MDMFRPIPCFSAGASFLLQGFFLCSILPILGPQRLRSWSSHIWIGNSLRWTRIFMWCNVLLRIERCDPIPKILCSSVKSTWISLALYPEIRKPKVLSSSIKHSILATTFLRNFAGLPVSLSMSEQALIAEFASRFSVVTLRYGRIPTITRRLRTISFEVILAQFLTFLSGWTTSPGSVSCWRSSSVILCRAILVQERKIVFYFRADCLRGGNCKSLLLNTVLLLSIDSILPFSSQRWRSSLLLLTNTPISILWFLILKFFVLIIWPMCLLTIVFNFCQRGVDRCWSSSRSYIVKYCLNCTDSRIRILHTPSKTLSLGISLVDFRSWSHLMSKSWMPSPCEEPQKNL